MIVLGFTGQSCSGKGTFINFVKELTGYPEVSLSDVIREELARKGEEITRDSLTKTGNELRKKHGSGFLAKTVSEKNNPPFIIDSIRNPAEVEVLRECFGEKFFLIRVTASERERFKRIMDRKRENDPKSWDEFVRMLETDRGRNQGSFGQLINKCEELADFVISNDGSVEELRLKAGALIDYLQ